MKLRENKGAANSIVVMLMVFILILVCLLFYLVKHPMVKVVEKDTANTQTQASVPETKTETATSKMTADEKYNIYLKNLKDNLLKMKDAGESPDGENKVDKSIIFDNQNSTWANNEIGNVSLEYNGDAYLNFDGTGTLSKKYGVRYKISTNIVNGGFVLHGQDAQVMLWLINDKGEFSYVNFSQFGNDTLELKKAENMKNIVSAATMNTGDNIVPVAIDIEGNMHNLL